MAAVRTSSDARNEFLGRRELVCDFEDAAGRLSRSEAVGAVRAEHGIEGGLVVPVRLQNHVGRTHVTGTFFVYEDGAAARAHIDPSVMARIEKSLAAKEEAGGEKEAGAEGEAKADGGGEKEADPGEKADGGGEKEAKAGAEKPDGGGK